MPVPAAVEPPRGKVGELAGGRPGDEHVAPEAETLLAVLDEAVHVNVPAVDERGGTPEDPGRPGGRHVPPADAPGGGLVLHIGHFAQGRAEVSESERPRSLGAFDARRKKAEPVLVDGAGPQPEPAASVGRRKERAGVAARPGVEEASRA